MTESEILDKIKAKAIAKWGEECWLSELTHHYYPIALDLPPDTPHEDNVQAFKRHRPAMGRIFDRGGGSKFRTLEMLCQAVELSLSIK
jgi:hypothetical protein